ncbi:MAG: hypothetical protein J6Y72_04620 [Bacteroidales bacterium]|jgi:hypothetical protein|nr:hypothetical protein [Bacteroidales bacterium]MBP5419073.1 hypothetical protein [Bacteroidales bacterium]MCR5696109.1 hypothetical protein [Marinilabiliaceae bacterium]
MRIITYILSIVLLSSCSLFYHKSDKDNSEIAGIIPLQDTDEGCYALEARYSNWPHPDSLIIYIDGDRYRVLSNGEVYSQDRKHVYTFGNEFPIEQLYFIQRGRDLFIFYTDVVENGASSFVKRISLDSGKILWTTEVDGFSFTKPLIRGQFAYIGTIGFIGKLKLKSGSFDWRYSGLGKDGRFNHFREIDFVSTREVRFVAPHPFSNESDTVVVNDITGEIIRIN